MGLGCRVLDQNFSPQYYGSVMFEHLEIIFIHVGFFTVPISSSLESEKHGSYFCFYTTKLHNLILRKREKLSGKASAGLCLLSLAV